MSDGAPNDDLIWPMRSEHFLPQMKIDGVVFYVIEAHEAHMGAHARNNRLRERDSSTTQQIWPVFLPRISHHKKRMWAQKIRK